MLKGNLRPISFDDSEMVLEWRNQDFVRLNMYYHEVIDLETHMKWFSSMMDDASSQYFIYEQNSIPLGLVAFTNIDRKNNKAFWAFYAADNKKIGVGVEMETLALQYAFEELQLNKLCCEVLEFNSSVISFHQKFGFKQEGIRRQDYFRDGKFFDIYELALFKDVYFKSKNVVEKRLKKRYQGHFSYSNNYMQSQSVILGDLTKNIFLELDGYLNAVYKINSYLFNLNDTQLDEELSEYICSFLLRTHIDDNAVIDIEVSLNEIIVLTGTITVQVK